MGQKDINLEKVWVSIFQVLVIERILLGKPKHFSCGLEYHRVQISWTKTTILWDKVWLSVFQFSNIEWLCCIFPCYEKLSEKVMQFSCDKAYHKMGRESTIMEENHPYFGKSLESNFPGSPHRMCFAAFSVAMGYWWKVLFNFHVMKYIIQ